uniref:Protein kinase domain-containing protein n=1 Tax=Acrobeloides nanus TaxID=290746 RepID=A0A914DUP0_9BILA
MRDIGEDDLRKYDVFSLGVVVLEYFCGMHPYDYILGNSQSRYLNDAVLAEEGELTKWSDEDSVFTENRLIEDNNFREFLSFSLRFIETRATPLELQQTNFYTVYKVPNSRTGVATILKELEIYPEPVIISQRQSTKPLPFLVFGFVLMAIVLFILTAIFLYIPPITECENIGGTCLNNETGCEGADRMIMPFSCSSKQPNAKCCVDAKEKAKIDSQKWQNNCSCERDKISENSVCIDEVPPGTKKLEEELNANFLYLIRTISNFNVCESESPQFNAKRAIGIHISSRLETEKKRAVEKFIYSYLFYIVTEKTPCSTGIEEIIHWEINEHNKPKHRWYANLTTPETILGHPYTSHITIILNSCGSENWGSADIGPL